MLAVATPAPIPTPTIPTPTSTATLSPAAASTLTFSQLLTVLIFIVGAFVAAGLIVLWGRKLMKTGQDTEPSLVRSWIALTVVIGLILFCGVALVMDDQDLRNVLIGALASIAGTVVAFYFSSKSADQARQDILNATFGTVTEAVPDLKGLTKEAALQALGQTSLQLAVNPVSSTAPDATVDSQLPLKDSPVRKGTQVVVTLVG